MISVLGYRYGRALGAGLLSVALLSGSAAGAYAAAPTPSPSNTMPSPTTTMASITITVNKTSVKSGQMVRVTGRTKGLTIGSPLVLQHQMNGTWTSLPATAKIKTGNAYAILAKLSQGTHVLRVAATNGSAKVFSSTVTVKVS
ncbi:hypothetical protein ACWC0C_13925 [Streptomyces sp. NPDC001709]